MMIRKNFCPPEHNCFRGVLYFSRIINDIKDMRGNGKQYLRKEILGEELYSMLKGIPKIISPELMKILMEMGHGDEIVLADANFPASSHAQRLIRCDGHNIPELLEAILKFFPLDSYVQHPVALMKVVPGDTVETSIWNIYRSILKNYISSQDPFDYLDRFNFYERAKNAYAIVATGESALYANIILKKGVII
jgi:L-fucose mutarotase